MKMKTINLGLIICLFLGAIPHGSQGQDKTSWDSVLVLFPGENTVSISSAITAFSIESDHLEDFTFRLGVEKEADFHNDIHIQNRNIANVIHRDKPFQTITFFVHSERKTSLRLLCFDGRYPSSLWKRINHGDLRHKKAACDKPEIVPQSLWRDGLPDPKPNPRSTNVAHLIIHHSATSNEVTDYLLAVRNIYLYHLETNGWDDVGYNFLLAPTGQIFAGRDGQGLEGDDVQGAHFCGKNSGTMGLCLLGNYSLVPPRDSMLTALANLLAWKLEKDKLQPLEDHFHPIGSSTGFLLPTICGHRDGYKPGVFSGCQTECPGDLMYPLIDTVTRRVVRNLLACNYPVSTLDKKEISNEHPILYTANSNEYISTQSGAAEIINLEGKVLWTGRLLENNKIPWTPTLQGVYILRLKSAHGTFTQQLLFR